MDHGDSDPRFGGFGQGFEVLTQSARAVEPTEGAFDDPAPLQDPKSLPLPRPFHDRFFGLVSYAQTGRVSGGRLYHFLDPVR